MPLTILTGCAHQPKLRLQRLSHGVALRSVRPRCRLPFVACVRTHNSDCTFEQRRCLAVRTYEPAASVARPNVPAPPRPRAMTPAAVSDGAWGIQVGAFSSRIQARVAANGVHDALVDLLSTAQIELLPTSPFGGRILYRARLSNLSAEVARTACVSPCGRSAALHRGRARASVLAMFGAYVVAHDVATYAITSEVAAGRNSPNGGVWLSFRHVHAGNSFASPSPPHRHRRRTGGSHGHRDQLLDRLPRTGAPSSPRRA